MGAMKININGQIVGPENAFVSVFDRGFLYGDSIYEVTFTINSKAFLMDEHMDRLWFSASRLALPIHLTKDEMKMEVEKTLSALGLPRAYVRIIITRGEGEISLDPNTATKNNLVIITKELKENPAWWYEKGVSVIIADTKRNPISSIDPNIKSGNYLNNVLAMAEARDQGVFDAIMLNHQGQVTEGTTSNIWCVRADEFITPPLEAGLLSGITRQTLMTLARASGMVVKEQNLTPEELLGAQEVFLTSSTKLLVPITKIDSQVISNGAPGPKTLKLLDIYSKWIEKQYGKGFLPAFHG